jgi:hypothetical protein
LFDENVPAPLRHFFPDDQVATVQQLGWSGISNGELLALAESDFEVILLADKNMRYQQNLAGRKIAIFELPTNRWPILEPLGISIAAAVHGLLPGTYTIYAEPTGRAS